MNTSDLKLQLEFAENEHKEIVAEWKSYFERHPEPNPYYESESKSEIEDSLKLIFELKTKLGIPETPSSSTSTHIDLTQFLANVDKQLNLPTLSVPPVTTIEPVAIQAPALPVENETSDAYPLNLPIADSVVTPEITYAPDWFIKAQNCNIRPVLSDKIWDVELESVEPTIPLSNNVVTTEQPIESVSSAMPYSILVSNISIENVEDAVNTLLANPSSIPSNPQWNVETDIGFEICKESIAYINSFFEQHHYLWLPDENNHGLARRQKFFDIAILAKMFLGIPVRNPAFTAKRQEFHDTGEDKLHFNEQGYLDAQGYIVDTLGIPLMIPSRGLQDVLGYAMLYINQYTDMDNRIPSSDMAKYEKRSAKQHPRKVILTSSDGVVSNEPKIDRRLKPKKDTSDIDAANLLWRDIVEEERQYQDEIKKVKLQHATELNEMADVLAEIRERKIEAKIAMNKLK